MINKACILPVTLKGEDFYCCTQNFALKSEYFFVWTEASNIAALQVFECRKWIRHRADEALLYPKNLFWRALSPSNVSITTTVPDGLSRRGMFQYLY
jgi:hypothetical protein